MNTKTKPDESFKESLTDEVVDDFIKVLTGVDPAQRRKELAEKNKPEETFIKEDKTKEKESKK